MGDKNCQVACIHTIVLIQPGGVRLKRTSAMVGGSKEKQTNAEKGGEGVQNPGNFADVLYVWSLT